MKQNPIKLALRALIAAARVRWLRAHGHYHNARLAITQNGRVQTLGVGVGTHHVVGRALDAAANAGDVIEVDPHYFLRVI